MQIPEHPNVPRLSFKGILEDIFAVFNLEKGIPYTFKRLIFDPRGAIEEYLFEDRRRLVKPVSLLVLMTAIAAYVSFRSLPLDIDAADSIRNSPGAAEIPPVLLKTLEFYLGTVRQFFNLTYMSSVPFLAGATFWLYGASRLNYLEHLAMNIYIFCVQTLVFIFTTPFVMKAPLAAFLQMVLVYGYLAYALKHIFKSNWGEAVGKTIAMLVIVQLLQLVLFALTLAWFAFFG